MDVISKSDGVWQCGECFIAQTFSEFKGKKAVVIEIDPIEINWNEIETRDFEVKSLGLKHLYLGGELGIFSVPPHAMITYDLEFFTTLAEELNAEFLGTMSHFVAERFEQFLKTVSFHPTIRFTLFGEIKEFLVDNESVLFRKRVHQLRDHYALLNQISPLDFEKKLISIRKHMVENIRAQETMVKGMEEGLAKTNNVPLELKNWIHTLNAVYSDHFRAPFEERASAWKQFLKQCHAIPVIAGTPDNPQAVATAKLLS